ncbi:hypothetical protein NKH60_32965 [Mesorhizobium sp. M1006]|uniref:hypothetical protein n=1 Tax=Mesorhizobium sp. M1006 TaxID=2957048 RepID=UPI003339808F
MYKRREGRRREAAELAEELEDFPPSLEKALSLVPARILQQPTPELYPILGIEPRTPEGHNAVVAVVARDHNGQDLPADWSYSLAWFLDLYGSATEAGRLDGALAECASHMIALGTGREKPPPRLKISATHSGAVREARNLSAICAGKLRS